MQRDKCVFLSPKKLPHLDPLQIPRFTSFLRSIFNRIEGTGGYVVSRIVRKFEDAIQ